MEDTVPFCKKAFKHIFEALIKGISKKEKYFAIILFHALSKSGVVSDDLRLSIFTNTS